MRRVVCCFAVSLLSAALLRPVTGREAAEADAFAAEPVPMDHPETDWPSFRENVLTDPSRSLLPFYERLANLKRGLPDDGEEVVSVLHIGDSHIQAGFLTGAVMRRFHSDFGNAGRGLVTPLKLAGTNEPSDYAILSNTPWESVKCVQKEISAPLGIGGISLYGKDKRFELTVGTRTRESSDPYAFRRIHFLHDARWNTLSLFGDSTRISATRLDNHLPCITTLQFDRPLSEITLRGETGEPALFYGAVLENGHNGVLYHSAGINGARYSHWNRVEKLEEQTAALEPALVILSLGTNESFDGSRFQEEELIRNMDRLVERVLAAEPGACILFTTPPQCYVRQRVRGKISYLPNPLTAKISELIREYASTHGYACWDFFTISGGEGSCEEWQKKGLMGRDRIHFTTEGYRLMGDYLYYAIVQGYNEYVGQSRS